MVLTAKSNQTFIIVGMSGGVDSSVTALLLKQQGFHVEGLFMKNWDEDDGTDYCTAKADLADAQQVCDTLGIKLHTANFAAEYWDNVFEHFLEEYRAGRTPNPDILCNREIKFKTFLDYAELIGADGIATGHYARLKQQSNDETFLLKGVDENKDQSYFLHGVDGKAFSKSRFPLGELNKPEVRSLAEHHGLITHKKKDSTGICFIGERRFKDFLETYLPAQPGDIVNEHGDILGQHDGLMFHTLGQRQGIGIGGVKNTNNAPWYVADKHLSKNTLLVVQGSEHPLLFHKHLHANQVHWINSKPQQATFDCQAKIRYRQADQACRVTVMDDELMVEFKQAQRAITPGQSLVLYDGELCLGGAVIKERY